MLVSTTAALRLSPARFARFIGDFRNAALNASWSSARMSRASVITSFPSRNGRALNGEPSANSCENFTFHGQTDWEMCRYNRFEIPLTTVRGACGARRHQDTTGVRAWQCDFSHTYCIVGSVVSVPEVPMAILVSKTRAQGASVVTTLPAEVARRLAVMPGQELEWIEDGMGGFRVVPHTPETAEALAVHEKIMAEYDAVFRALAK